MTWALVLAEVVPEQRDALIARAHLIGDDRVLGGVHSPSDVEAGRTLAAAIAKQLVADPQIQTLIAKAKSECAAAMAKHAN